MRQRLAPRRSGGWSSWVWSTWRARMPVMWASASRSSSRWRGRWPPRRRFCCWTSRRLGWTRSGWSAWWSRSEDYATQGRTVCLVEHNLHVVEQLADRAYFMELGRITAEGCISDLCADPRLAKVYFGGC